MAVTENNYVGDGSTVLYSFTFEYIDEIDVKASLDGVETTDFTFDNATTIRFATAPSLGVLIRIFRRTETDEMPAIFYPGSTIQAKDLNDNFNVSLFVSQEASRDSADAGQALPVAIEARAIAQAAEATANSAATEAQQASNSAANATLTANQASADAAQAQTTADNAVNIAEDAEDIANAAAALVASANLPTPVANVAAIPQSPPDNTLIEVRDSTGIQLDPQIDAIPAGFIGDPGLAVRILFSSSNGRYTFVEYRATDPDDRYATEAEVITLVDDEIAPLQSDVTQAQNTANTALNTAQAALPLSGGTMTGPIVFANGQDFGIQTGNEITEGVLRLSNSTSSASGVNGGIAATPQAAKQAYDRGTSGINIANAASATANTANATANTALATANAAQSGLNDRVAKAGDTMTGNLSLPGGTSGLRLTFAHNAIEAGIRYNSNNELHLRNNNTTGLNIKTDGEVVCEQRITAPYITVTNSGGGTAPTIRFDDNDTGLYYAPGTNNGSIRFSKNGQVQWSFAADKLTFNTGEGDIESFDGNNDGENSAGFRLRGRGRGNNNPSWFAANTESSSNRVLIVRGDGGSNDAFIFYADGSADTRGNSVSSDINLKQNIKDARPQWDDVKALRFRNFEYKEKPGVEQFGWIAQEVQLVSPGAVTDRGSHLSVKADLLTWKGLKALQEAMLRIEELEARVAALEA